MASDFYYIGSDQPFATGYVQTDGTMQTLEDIHRDGASDLQISLVDQASLTSVPDSLRGAKYIVKTADLIAAEYIIPGEIPPVSGLLMAYLQHEVQFHNMMFMLTTESGTLETFNVRANELTAEGITNSYGAQKQWIITNPKDVVARETVPADFDIVRNNIDGIDYYAGAPAGSLESFQDDDGQFHIALEFPWQFNSKGYNRLVTLGDGSITAIILNKTLLKKSLSELFYLFDADVGFHLLVTEDGMKLRTGRKEQLFEAALPVGDTTVQYSATDMLVVTNDIENHTIRFVRVTEAFEGKTRWTVVFDTKKLALKAIKQTAGTKYHDAEIETDVVFQSDTKYSLTNHYLKFMRDGFWIIWDGEEFIKIGQEENGEPNGIMEFRDTQEGQVYHMKTEDDHIVLTWVTQEGVIIIEDRTEDLGIRSYFGGRTDDYPVLFEIFDAEEDEK
jgi:hypothetical protein